MSDTATMVVQRSRTRLIGALAWSVVVAIMAVLLVAAPPAKATTYTVTFPQGSTLQIDPTVFNTIPLRQVDQTIWLEFGVGDTLVVTNEDLFTHVLWAIRVRPGETVEYRFTQAGTFSGECTFDLEVFLEVRKT